MFSTGEEERARLEKVKAERLDKDTINFKSIISNLERRIEEESRYRNKNEEDLRLYADQKIEALEDKMKSEERTQLEREKRLMFQLQEGLTTVNEIIKGAKEQNLISLTH